jgi:hypothetical protein
MAKRTGYGSELEERNAVIEDTRLGMEAADWKCFSYWIHVKWDGGGQGFGGHSMDGPVKDEDGKFLRRAGSAFGCDAIIGVLEAIGVGNWEKLPGTPVRIRHTNDRIWEIGHYYKDDWFSLTELADQHKFGQDQS